MTMALALTYWWLGNYGQAFDFTASRRIIGSDDLIRRRLKAGEDPRTLETLPQDDVERSRHRARRT